MSAKNQQWKTVSGTLNNSAGFQKFKEFQKERDAESSKEMVLNCLDFFEKCEAHKVLQDESELRNSAESILEEYLRPEAPKEIPVMHSQEGTNVRNKLDDKELSIGDLQEIFNRKQEDVYAAIEDDGSHDLFYTEISKKSSKCVIV